MNDQMTNDEGRMTKETRNLKSAWGTARCGSFHLGIGISEFGILSAFVIRLSSFHS